MATFIDLCSGIGGGRLGLKKNGFKCLGFSEILKTSNRDILSYPKVFCPTFGVHLKCPVSIKNFFPQESYFP